MLKEVLDFLGFHSKLPVGARSRVDQASVRNGYVENGPTETNNKCTTN